MARDINKTRMRDSRIMIGFAFLVSALTKPAISPAAPLSEIMEALGFALLAACAIGRIYSTAFIGGIKNQQLVMTGPYSMHRNPLYFYSLLGAAGIGMISGQLALAVFLTGGFFILYTSLIKREEEYLAAKFGKEYSTYRDSTPRLFPNPRKFTCPEEVTLQTRFFSKAVWDAVWWFSAVPIFEAIHYLHETGTLKALFPLI